MFSKIKNVLFGETEPLITVFRHTYAPGVSAVPAVTWLFEIDHNNRKIRFSMAVCSYKDAFAKAVGRHHAQHRFQSGDVWTMPYEQDIPLVSLAVKHLDELVSNNRSCNRSCNRSTTRSKELLAVKALEAYDIVGGLKTIIANMDTSMRTYNIKSCHETCDNCDSCGC